MNVIPMCPTHHTELHANRRNYGALYGIEEQALADEMRTRFMPMLRQSTESRLHGRLRPVQRRDGSRTSYEVAREHLQRLPELREQARAEYGADMRELRGKRRR